VSTFLQTLAVVVISIAAATAIAVKDPDQPATLRNPKRRDEAKRHADTRTLRIRRERSPRPPRLVPRNAEPSPAARPLRVPATVEVGGFSDHWVPAPVGPTAWMRLRSGMVLTVLLAMIGTLVAITIGGVIVFIAVALRSAVS
jgi:hypothetical protein